MHGLGNVAPDESGAGSVHTSSMSIVGSGAGLVVDFQYMDSSVATLGLEEACATDDLMLAPEARDIGPEDQGGESPPTMIPSPGIEGGHVIKNYPRVSASEACRRHKLGQDLFTIAWNGLVCMPVGFTNLGVGYACGIVGHYALQYLSDDAVCRAG